IYIPNNEIKECFKEKILEFFKTNTTYNSNIINLVKSLFAGNREDIAINIKRLLSRYISIRDFATKAPHENLYHGFLGGAFATVSSDILTFESNAEAGDGYADFLLKSEDNQVVIIEIKQTNNKKDIKSKISQEAIEQIITQKYAEDFIEDPDYKSVTGIGICFYKKDCSVAVKKFK
ncbi:MAG: PD-(D/E)XK nuclease domain-containing protein, partial [Succinivibrionaceae bacterium]